MVASPLTDTEALFRAIQDWCARYYPRATGIVLSVVVPDAPAARLPITPALPVPDQAPGLPTEQETAAFVPTANQDLILDALAGKGLRTDALCAAAGLERSQLFRKPKGGLQELKDQGLVAHNDRLGYFRPDDPPPELAE